MEAMVFCGRQFSSADLQLIGDVVERYGSLSREELANTVCELLEWQRSGGGLKARECREFLEILDRERKLKLPALRIGRPTGRATHIPISAEG